jgi:hypothetical protein
VTVPRNAPLMVAANLELHAKRLRKMAEAWCASGEPPTVTLNGTDCPILSLSYSDLIEDACDLERDAAKLRATYAN